MITSSSRDRPMPVASSRFVKAYQSFGSVFRRSTPLTSRAWTPRPQFVTCIDPLRPGSPGGKAMSVREEINAPAVFVLEFQPLRHADGGGPPLFWVTIL